MFSRQIMFRVLVLLLIPAGVVPAQDGKNGANAASASQGSGNGAVHMQFSLNNAAGDQPVTVTISGKVTDQKTGQAIPGALVRGHIVTWRNQGPDLFDKCPYQETHSAPDGTYKLSFTTILTTAGPMKGTDGGCVYVSAPGYETRPEYVSPHITPLKKEFSNFDFALAPGKLINGKIVDEDRKPIQDAIVEFDNNWNGDWGYFGCMGQTRTNAEGDFELWVSTDREKVVGERPWLSVRKQGYGSERYLHDLKAESVGTLVLTRGGTIAGRVVDVDGKGIPGVEASVRGYYAQIDKAITDKDGRYELRGVAGKGVEARFMKAWRPGEKVRAEVSVYARPDPALSLRDVPQYKITAKDGQTVTGPDLVVGGEAGVSGKVIPSGTTFGLKGLLVRLDYDWGKMVEVDADGNFRFSIVPPGKHRLAVYLPTNLRYDPGIGRTEIKVEPGQSLVGVQIKLDQLAEVRVQILDAAGTPLEGITAGATWSKTGEGAWTEGTRSDKDGNAVVYVYPEKAQYVRGFDMDGKLVAEGSEKVEAKPAEVIEGIRIVMVAPAQLAGRLVARDGASLVKKRLLATVKYADGNEQQLPLKIDAAGAFQIGRLVPGVVSLSIESTPAELAGATAQALEVKPGQTADVGQVTLTKLKMCTVSGRLMPSPSFQNLKGFKVRLDLMAWEPMVETDAEGRFTIPNVPPGKHRLTAYVPFNLRTDRGVGHTEVVVTDKDVAEAKLPLESLATVHMRIVDSAGKPLEGLPAAAFWTPDHSGVFTEGAKSDAQGNAVLYMYPNEKQYIGAIDWDRKWKMREHKEMTLKPGRVVKDVTVVMVPAAAEEQDE